MREIINLRMAKVNHEHLSSKGKKYKVIVILVYLNLSLTFASPLILMENTFV